MKKLNRDNNDTFTLYYNLDTYHLFIGRVIGFLDNKQFASILKNPRILSRKLSSMEPLEFYELISGDMTDMRLAFITKDIGNIPHLIISGKITEVNSSLSNDVGEISFVDSDNNFFFLETDVW